MRRFDASSVKSHLIYYNLPILDIIYSSHINAEEGGKILLEEKLMISTVSIIYDPSSHAHKATFKKVVPLYDYYS
jgi:hypothetical protein